MKTLILFLSLLISSSLFAVCEDQVEVLNVWPQGDIVASGTIGVSFEILNPLEKTVDELKIEIHDSSTTKLIAEAKVEFPEPTTYTAYWNTTSLLDAYYLLSAHAKVGACTYSTKPLWIWVNNYGE